MTIYYSTFLDSEGRDIAISFTCLIDSYPKCFLRKTVLVCVTTTPILARVS